MAVNEPNFRPELYIDMRFEVRPPKIVMRDLLRQMEETAIKAELDALIAEIDAQEAK